MADFDSYKSFHHYDNTASYFDILSQEPAAAAYQINVVPLITWYLHNNNFHVLNVVFFDHPQHIYLYIE